MLELIAQGTDVDSRWRRQLPDHGVEVGRATEAYRVPWDNQISRKHIWILAREDSVLVEKLPGASNPVFFDGHERESFELAPGEHFVIGNTTFTLTADRAFVSLDVPNPVSQKTYSPEFLRQVSYRDADRRIDVLNRIPEAISSAGNTEDLLIRMVNTLMTGIRSASTIGIVQLDNVINSSLFDNILKTNLDDSSDDVPQDAIQIIQWDRRGLDSGDFQPSATLIRQAIQSGETILHIWNQRRRSQSEYTYDYENDWAFVSPISSEASPGWGIYVTGTNYGNGGSAIDIGSEEVDLQGDIKFCELVGSTLRNLLLVRQLERQRSSLRAFFSPIVMQAFEGRDPEEVLSPRKCDVSVLFCDLRGFSKTSEKMADNLLELLAQVSEALGITTSRILDHGGVIGDFHGDAAMGFWGWPLESADPFESAVEAVAAALEIQNDVANKARLNSQIDQTNVATGFQIGMGIASGESVAGKIGTRDQVKVTAFGPVVNMAARLEGMTRLLGSSILTDDETVRRINLGYPATEKPTTRSLGLFQPYGMESSQEVFQVIPAGVHTVDDLKLWDSALEKFQSGDWELATTELLNLPPTDSARRFMSTFIDQHKRVPPDGWTGVVQLHSK